MDRNREIIERIEQAAEALGIAPSTAGRLVGQGGRFYRRLCDGHRIWPETAEKVYERLDALLKEHDSHGPAKEMAGEAQ